MTDLRPCPYTVAQLLPQEPPMRLLDEIIGWNDDRLVASVTVRLDCLFLDGDEMPSYVAIEWMAQTCGAMVGAQALERGQPVRIGFLLGTRDFRADASRFQLGDVIAITARPIFTDGQMAVFDCQVERQLEICATARLSLFQPESLQTMLEAQGLALERQ